MGESSSRVAETLRSPISINRARSAIDNLSAGIEKTRLQSRLSQLESNDNVTHISKSELAAEKAVKRAETLLYPSLIRKAVIMVDKLSESTKKKELLERVNNLRR